jgi:hypothetical protein
VVVSDRDVATAEETAAAIRAGGGKALALGCDVTTRTRWPRWSTPPSRDSGGSISW